MSLYSTKIQAVLNAPRGDVHMTGMSWLEIDAGIELKLVYPGADYPGVYTLRCSWVSHLQISIETRVDEAGKALSGGPPMTWDTSFEQNASGRWRVAFDFASAGEVQFECSDMELLGPDEVTG
jgi:hypothetical protein